MKCWALPLFKVQLASKVKFLSWLVMWQTLIKEQFTVTSTQSFWGFFCVCLFVCLFFNKQWLLGQLMILPVDTNKTFCSVDHIYKYSVHIFTHSLLIFMLPMCSLTYIYACVGSFPGLATFYLLSLLGTVSTSQIGVACLRSINLMWS